MNMKKLREFFIDLLTHGAELKYMYQCISFYVPNNLCKCSLEVRRSHFFI